LNGVQAKEHAVFKELTRVRQYFAKIKEAESGGVKPRENLNLNKQAAGRFIKHALVRTRAALFIDVLTFYQAGNDKYDAERAERELKEKLLAKRKLQSLETNMRKKAKVNNDPVRAAELSEGEIDEEAPTPDTFFQPDNEAVQTSEIIEEPGQSERPNKRRRKSRDDNSKGLEVATESEESKKARKEQKALRKQRKKETKQAAALAG
jgi:exosome complex protein LRP1